MSRTPGSGRKITLVPLPPEQVDPQCRAKFHAAARTAYTHHRCRCLPAKRAYSRETKLYRNGFLIVGAPVHAIGTRRRLQALACKGHTMVSIARAAGVNKETLRHVRSGRHRKVTPVVADAVRRVYDLWWDTDGGSVVAKTQAAEHGWAPPMWWDDDHIDDPRSRGPNLTTQEDCRAG